VDASLFGQGEKIAKFHHATSSEMMNLSALVWKNGSTSHYMRNELSFSTTLTEIIWHIGTYVKHLEAWEKGNAAPQRGGGSRLYGGVLFFANYAICWTLLGIAFLKTRFLMKLQVDDVVWALFCFCQGCC